MNSSYTCIQTCRLAGTHTHACPHTHERTHTSFQTKLPKRPGCIRQRLPATVAEDWSLTVVIKRHIVLHKGLKVLAVVHHVLDHLLPVAIVVAAVALQLVPQGPEQTVAETTTVNSLHSGWTMQQTTAFTPVETTQQSAVFTPAKTTQQSTVFTPVETTQQSTVFTPVEPCKSQQYFVLIKSQEGEYNSPKWDSNWKVLNPSPVWPPKWVIHRLTHYWLWRGNRVLIQSGYWCLLFCWCFFLRQNVCVFVCACVQLKFAFIH